MMTAPPGRPLFGGKSLSGDQGTQSSGTSYGSSRWPASENIWGNNSAIGSGTTFAPNKREIMGSRAGSDEASPTAPSGSAQLNHMSEAEPSWGARKSFWKETPSQGRPASGHTSPSHTRDNGIVPQHGLPDASYFPTRSAVGQNGSTFSGRAQDHSVLDSSSAPFKSVFSVPSSDVNDSGVSYSSISRSRFDTSNATYKKCGSQEHTFMNMVPSRENSTSSTRPSEAVPNFGHLSGEMSHYSFDHGTYAIPLNAGPRPSIPQHMSFPSGTGSARGLPAGNPGMERGLSDLFNQSLNINDSETGNIGHATNGFSNGPSTPFQFNPGSQPWAGSNDVGNNGRVFGQAYPQRVYDQMPGQYFVSKRVSASPAGSVHRPSLNSPRYAPTPKPGADSWPRPPSANPSVVQDLERQSTGSHYVPQNLASSTGFYPGAPGMPYFGNNFQSQYSQNGNIYDYGQHTMFRGPVQFPYGVPVNPVLPGVVIPNRPNKDKDPGHGYRSVILEEFRASNKSSKRFELKEIYGHIVEFSGDQHGSRFIQEKLQTANSDEKEQVFREIQPNALQLMKDVFGNYVIQKFFEHGNQVQKKILAKEMKGKVAELSTQMYACRVVQKALEHVLVEQQAEIVDELRPDIIRIVKDQNGNHVIQKIISMVPQLCLPFLMVEFHGQISALAGHSYGCRVIQRMLEKGDGSQRRALMEEVHACAPQLISDQYGNYVAQHIIAQGEPEDRSRMIRHVINELLTLSKHKFASNVVEKCIEFGTAEERKAIKAKLTTAATPDGSSPLQTMMKDQFGNYVIQKMVQQLNGEDRESFVEELEPQLVTLKKISTGRQITAIERLSYAVGSSRSGAPRSTNGVHPGVTTPSSPGLQVDVHSVAPTPALTTEHNSPASNSPPSTNLSMEDETIDYKGKSKVSPVDGQPELVVQDDDSNK